MLVNHEGLWTLLEVSRAGTHAAAAARLGVTPSAVGQQLKALEGQLGLALFERVGRRSRLTTAGAVLVARLEEHLPAVEAAIEEARAEQTVVRGEVRFGGPAPFCRVWLRPRLPPLLARYPELTLSVRFGVASVLLHRLLAGEVDLVVLSVPADEVALESRPIAQEEFIAVAAPRYLGERGMPRTVTDFSAQRYIAFDEDLAMLTPWWHAAFGPRTPLPKGVVCHIANLDEMLALAEAGCGIAVLPDYLVEDSLRAGRVQALKPERRRGSLRQPRGTLWLAWRRAAAPTARFLAVRDWLLEASPAALQGPR
ncbi:LysR family transcriptional regulator [Archangium lansingense]|uniref:LysR family transcriptional regulator n=1 Tax=Archangium lansingense TaxID=2995310 RepID=UPI003B7D8C99